MTNDLNRRDFLSRSGSVLTAVWVSAHWPALLSAATHARNAARLPSAPKLEFFNADQAKEIDAITARIIPTDETPGAHEAGTVYFIDRALTTFFVDDQKAYREGLPEFAARTHKMFPALDKFSAASPAQQDEILRSFDPHQDEAERLYGGPGGPPSFVETLRSHTVVAFLLDPDAGGDPNGIGWKVIGRDRQRTFQPPFGYYDKNYPGWQPVTDKAKS